MAVKSYGLMLCLLVAACGQQDTSSPDTSTTEGQVPTSAPQAESAETQIEPSAVEMVEVSAEDAGEETEESLADEPPQKQNSPTQPAAIAKPVPDGQVPLNPQQTVLIDAAQKRVFLKATVVLREGVLEMFACLAGTKEHESVVAVDTEAYVIHTALLAVGAEPGQPVQFEPEYRPPQGQSIDVFVNWTDEDGRPYRVPAQYWMRHTTRRYYLEPLAALPEDVTLPEDSELRYDDKRQELIWFGPMDDQQRFDLMALSEDEPFEKLIQKFYDDSQTRQMNANFVFAGSGFYEEEDGTRFYLAESGNLICVANFSDAIIDVAVKSDASNDALMYEPYTERIPPLGTEVMVELVPRSASGGK